MTISRVGTQAGAATPVDGGTSISRAFPSNVAVGNIVWFAAAAADTTHTFVASDCTKSAGTATINSPVLLAVRNQDQTGYFIPVGIWAAKVTASGSLTLQAAGLTSGAFWIGGSGEITSTIGFSDTFAGASNSNGTAIDNSSPASSGNASSVGAAFYIAALGAGGGATVTVGAPGSSFSAVMEEENGAAHMVGAVADLIVSGATTTGTSWTLSSGSTIDGWATAIGIIEELVATSTDIHPEIPRATLAAVTRASHF